MTAKPAISTWANAYFWYGFGLLATTQGYWANSGSVDGTITYWIHTSDGFVWVVFFNYRPGDPTDQDNMLTDIDPGLFNAAGEVTSWPTNDQFVNYPDTLPQITQSQPALTTREGVLNGATFDRGVVSGPGSLCSEIISQTPLARGPRRISSMAIFPHRSIM